MVNFRLLIMSILAIQSFNSYSMDVLKCNIDSVISEKLKFEDFVKEFAELVLNNNVSEKELRELYRNINSTTDNYKIRIRILDLINIWFKYKKYVTTEIRRLKIAFKKDTFSDNELVHIKSFKQYYKSKI